MNEPMLGYHCTRPQMVMVSDGIQRKPLISQTWNLESLARTLEILPCRPESPCISCREHDLPHPTQQASLTIVCTYCTHATLPMRALLGQLMIWMIWLSDVTLPDQCYN